MLASFSYFHVHIIAREQKQNLHEILIQKQDNSVGHLYPSTLLLSVKISEKVEYCKFTVPG